MNPQRLIVGTFFLACATIAWTDIKKNATVPAPYRFIGAGMVYGVLAILVPFAGPAAAMVGVGYYLVLLYRFFGSDGTDAVGDVEGPGAAIAGSQTAVAIRLLNGSPVK